VRREGQWFGDEARTAQAFIRDARARIRGAEVSV